MIFPLKKVLNKDIMDLLSPKVVSRAGNQFKKDKGVAKLIEFSDPLEANTKEAMMSYLSQGCTTRTTGSMDMKLHSSCSHAIFIITLKQHEHGAVDTLVGKLVMVDLAGSERMNKIGDNKLRQQEGINIDNSLSTLSNVLFALSKGDNHVSYQNNTLTYLLNNDLTSQKGSWRNIWESHTIEAMAFGLPVLGTNAGGTKQIVEHNVTCLLHPLGRPGSIVLAQNLLFLLNNPSEREQMGMRGRRKVESMYLKHDMYEKFAFILFKCMRIK